jgi:uncharacterized protein (TIGR02453 family)
MKQGSRFSRETLKFLAKSGKQKNPNWLERNRDEYEEVLRAPLQSLASSLQTELRREAPGYHFPQKGIGRLRRPAQHARGGGIFKSWMAYSASVPSGSRFDHNPNLFFLIHPDDGDDPVLVAGGLYMPSSRQLRSIREAVAKDATPFDRLFASKTFSRRFPGGFSREKTATRPPRGFDPAHPRMDWLKLQAYFVWRPYTLREFSSPGLNALVASDFRQILRLNELLTRAISGRWPPTASARGSAKKPSRLADRLETLDAPVRSMDF